MDQRDRAARPNRGKKRAGSPSGASPDPSRDQPATQAALHPTPSARAEAQTFIEDMKELRVTSGKNTASVDSIALAIAVLRNEPHVARLSHAAIMRLYGLEPNNRELKAQWINDEKRRLRRMFEYYRSGVLPPLEQLVAADERGAATRLPPLSAAPPNVCRSLQAPPLLACSALAPRRRAAPIATAFPLCAAAILEQSRRVRVTYGTTVSTGTAEMAPRTDFGAIVGLEVRWEGRLQSEVPAVNDDDEWEFEHPAPPDDAEACAVQARLRELARCGAETIAHRDAEHAARQAAEQAAAAAQLAHADVRRVRAYCDEDDLGPAGVYTAVAHEETKQPEKKYGLIYGFGVRWDDPRWKARKGRYVNDSGFWEFVHVPAADDAEGRLVQEQLREHARDGHARMVTRPREADEARRRRAHERKVAAALKRAHMWDPNEMHRLSGDIVLLNRRPSLACQPSQQGDLDSGAMTPLEGRPPDWSRLFCEVPSRDERVTIAAHLRDSGGQERRTTGAAFIDGAAGDADADDGDGNTDGMRPGAHARKTFFLDAEASVPASHAGEPRLQVKHPSPNAALAVQDRKSVV